MKIIMENNYYDVTELSQMFGLSASTMRSYFKEGRISAIKIGKSWHATENDIKDFLNSNKTESKN